MNKYAWFASQLRRFGRHVTAPVYLCLCAAAIAVIFAVPAQAFTFDPSTMKGHWSVVKMELDDSGALKTSVATTPDPTDPNAWHEPAYPTTYLCRNPGETADRPGCRSYIVYIPSTYDGLTRVPLYLSLHGNGGFAEQQMGRVKKHFSGASPVTGDTGDAGGHSGLEGRLNELAEAHNFIAVYPNGTHDATATTENGRLWNDCRINEPAGSDVYDDVGFFRRLLDDLETSLNIDTRRIYAHGYSNGAIMTFRLYIELGERFTAFATTEGNMPQVSKNECPLPTAKKPIMMVFGDADFVVPYYSIGVRLSMMTADNTIKFWTQHLGTEQPTSDDEFNWTLTWFQVPDINKTDGLGNVAGDSIGYTHLFDYGDPGTEGVGPTRVWVKKIQGGGHSLSGFEQLDDPDPKSAAVLRATLGPKNMDVQAADELYLFFHQFSMAIAEEPFPMGAGCTTLGLSTSPTGEADATRGTPAPFGWEDKYRQIQVCYPSRQSGAQQAGYLFAPVDIDSRPPFSLPVVVIGPGSGTGRAYNYLWAARELASQGYIALVSDPQGSGSSQIVGNPARCGADGCPGVPWQQADNYVDNLLSATDFMFSLAHPWLLKADLTKVGMAGHSLSARATSYVQGIDDRIKAAVAWDNNSSTLEGDVGISSGGGACGSLIGGEVPGPSKPVLPRVPILGEASDASPGCDPTNTNPEIKKTGYEAWRATGVPAMQVVFKGASHLNWAQTSTSKPEQLQLFQYYTRAWFDLYLKQDEGARNRLMAREVLNQTSDQIFSSTFLSAVFMPQQSVDCPNLRGGICVPRANLQVTPASGTLPLLVTLDATRSSVIYSSDPIINYTFDFGDGTPAVTQPEPTLTHIYSRSGLFTPSVKAADGHGLVSAAAQQTVLVNSPPVAVLQATPPSGIVPLAVNFDASGSQDPDAGDSIRSYTFYFGDGSTPITQTGPTISHTYLTLGTYPASVVVTDMHGASSAAATQNIVAQPIPVNPAISVQLTASPLSGDVSATGLLVHFTASATDTDGSTLMYTFVYGDGMQSEKQSVPTSSHTYKYAGTYSAYVIVTDEKSNVASSAPIVITTAATVTVGPGTPTTAKLSFNLDPLSGVSPVTVTFGGSGSTAANGTTITNYTFDFGDGSDLVSGPAATVTHVYTVPRTYTVTLTVTDSDGGTSSAQATITVVPSNQTTAQLSVSPTIGIAPLLVTFDGSRSIAKTGTTISTFTFNFGDGSGIQTGTASIVTHLYTVAGNYQPTLSVMDNENVISIAKAAVLVTPVPAAAEPRHGGGALNWALLLPLAVVGFVRRRAGAALRQG